MAFAFLCRELAHALSDIQSVLPIYWAPDGASETTFMFPNFLALSTLLDGRQVVLPFKCNIQGTWEPRCLRIGSYTRHIPSRGQQSRPLSHFRGFPQPNSTSQRQRRLVLYLLRSVVAEEMYLWMASQAAICLLAVWASQSQAPYTAKATSTNGFVWGRLRI
ncbi:hypothetical protein BU16DRAFT_542671 [Lophium mytilinum]|uniref:Uncharacterized protein n=1 Tax=Lophium mytilinum TaxID=390894 RepID=A0A6A6QHK0_9PEZI|nr:hypothetical protein BU16DRAFT_542671 [Lophium mytilinum]